MLYAPHSASSRLAKNASPKISRIHLIPKRQNTNNKNNREKLFGIIPWLRPSTAKGYSQALDETWEQYIDETGNTWARRGSFSDSADFIGWYAEKA